MAVVAMAVVVSAFVIPWAALAAVGTAALAAVLAETCIRVPVVLATFVIRGQDR